MLRRTLIVIAVLLMAGGIGLRLAGAPGWNLVLMGAVLALALVFERWRYRTGDATDADRWRRTEERFEDPESGQVMEVLYDPATGQRRYVKAGAAPGAPKSDELGRS